ncbi:hypothetical protein HOI18_02055 [Candidatus Uhrbacteria bacterium]|jgi:hypothetical protein|nr:hypothetical protein [Candidatus Uhrbacteria bacterium]
MSNEDIAVEMVVRLTPDVHECGEYSLRNKHGEVVEIDAERGERCICVRVGVGRFGTHTRIVDRLGWFARDEIEVLEGGWTQELRAAYLFGRKFRAINSFRIPWNSERPCMHAAHDGIDPPNSTRRIMINAWGEVCEIDVCAEHERLDGACMDQVPFGERWRRY